MALTDSRPDTERSSSYPEVPTAAADTVDGWLGATDHKPIGRRFIILGALMLLVGTALGLVAAFESADGSGFQIARDADEYTQIWSIGRDLVMFGAVVPILIGLGLYLVPLQIGASSAAFARGAAAAFWTWALGVDLLIISYLLNGGPGGGRADFVLLWATGLGMMLFGLVWAMVVLLSTILGARTVGMTTDRVPFTTWGFFVFSLVGIFSVPITMAELLLGYLNVRYGHLPVAESESLAAVMDGVSFAPSIYWLGIPVLGMGVDIIGSHTGVPVNARKPIMAALTAFGVLTFGADLVAMASVRTLDFNNGLLVIGLLGAAVPVLAILGLSGLSIRNGEFRARTALLGALLSGVLVLAAAAVSLLGVVEPIMVGLDNIAAGSVDLNNTLVVNGTTLHEAVRALMIGAAVVGVIGALHHWANKIWGRRLTESLGMLSLLLAAGGSLLWALGELVAGIADRPFYSAVGQADFDTSGLVGTMGFVSAIGVLGLVGAAALLTLNLASNVFGSKPSGSSPDDWTGSTLEWATASPPGIGNFPGPPIVVSANPLLDGALRFDGIASEAAVVSDESDADGEDA